MHPRSSALVVAFLAPAVPAGALAGAMSRFYDAIAIVQPANETTIFDNNGKVEVAVSLSPALRDGDRIALELDGHRERQSSDTRLELSGVERGEHVLQARAVDRNGTLLISSAPARFKLWHA